MEPVNEEFEPSKEALDKLFEPLTITMELCFKTNNYFENFRFPIQSHFEEYDLDK